MKLFFIIILFSHSIFISGQIKTESDAIVKQLIKSIETHHKPIAILESLDSSIVEYSLTPLLKSEDLIFNNQTNDSIYIELTSSERDHLINSIRKQFSNLWSNENMKSYKLIPLNKLYTYFRLHTENHLVMISKPIFIRNKEIAMMITAVIRNGCGYCDLSFYNRNFDTWLKWITISAGSW